MRQIPRQPAVVTPASVEAWQSDMSGFAEDMAVAIAAELDRHHEAGPLAAALQALFSEALAAQYDKLNATATADGTAVVEDSGSGDGGTLVRDGDKWWLKQPSWAKPADPSEQHFLAAQDVISCQLWANVDEVALVAGWLLNPPKMPDPDAQAAG